MSRCYEAIEKTVVQHVHEKRPVDVFALARALNDEFPELKLKTIELRITEMVMVNYGSMFWDGSKKQ